MFDVRPFKESDYEVFNKWVNEYGWGGIPRNALPQIGIVVYGAISNLPMAMGFLYKADQCDLCIMDFVVADPELPSTRKLRATQALIQKLQEIAKEQTNNKGWLYSMSPNKAYIRIAETQGFQVAERDVVTIFYPLDGNTERVGFLCSELKE